MLEKLLKYLENKNIIILGFGKEGESTYRFLRSHFPEMKLTISDKNTKLLDSHLELFEDENVEVVLGENYLNDLDTYDLIIKAPGISLKDVNIDSFKDKITSQLELFLEYVDVFSIGITGTKGKSTTSSLMYKVLFDQGKSTFLVGNIGEPIFNEIEEFKSDSIPVIELSSHALEFVHRSTNIAFLIDIYEEHLDHYKSLEKYIEAKFNVAKYQNDNDYLIYNYDNKLMNEYGFNYKSHDIAVSLDVVPEKENRVYIQDDYIYYNEEKLMNIHESMNLKGIHNINNIMFILGACKILDLDIPKAINSIKEFKPLEHRMEFVGNINGVDYYNDSIATIPESTIDAIEAIGNINTIIVGGNDRGIPLVSLIEYLKKSDIENIICLPKTGEYIRDGLEGSNKNVIFTEKLEEAVKISKEITKKNTVCLLSPAASSYGYFKNFEERGKLFKQYVLEGNLHNK